MKYLGVIFDIKLNFTEHVQYVSKKINKVIAKVSMVFRNTFGYGNAA